MNQPFQHSGSRGVALVVVLWAVTLISAAMLGLAALLQRQLGQEVAGCKTPGLFWWRNPASKWLSIRKSLVPMWNRLPSS